VCRGVIKKFRTKKHAEEKSVFVHRHNPFLKLGPFKIQILSEVPIKLIIVDIFSDRETTWMYSSAMSNFNSQTDQVIQPEIYGNASTSSQSNAVALAFRAEEQWDIDYNDKLLKTYDRITLATGLYTRPPWASETLRVSSYGVAGMKVRQYFSIYIYLGQNLTSTAECLTIIQCYSLVISSFISRPY
jgi:hypothetical protein